MPAHKWRDIRAAKFTPERLAELDREAAAAASETKAQRIARLLRR
jgi:hypothetical protein